MDPCEIIINEFRIEKVAPDQIDGFCFKNPIVVEIIDTDNVPHLMITENKEEEEIETEEARISLNYLTEIEKLFLDSRNINQCYKISGTDESLRMQEFYIMLTYDFVEKLMNELEYKKILYAAERAANEDSKEYKLTIEKNFGIFKKLSNL